LFVEYVNKRSVPPFSFFLLSFDELELQDSFFLSSLIEMPSCTSGVGISISNSSGFGARI
jgi:hypothetical protein